jgi:hypothetical protein
MIVANIMTFGRQYLKPNTFIGGVGAQVTSEAILALVLSPELVASDIKIFKITGLNISCYIEKRYNLILDTFNVFSSGNTGNWFTNFGNSRTLTYFLDLEGKVISGGDQNFLFQQNCNFVFLPRVSALNASQMFRGIGGACVYLNGDYPFIGLTSASVSGNYFNQYFSNPNKVYATRLMQTNNSGNVDATIVQYLATQAGANVQYLDSLDEIPADVQTIINNII